MIIANVLNRRTTGRRLVSTFSRAILQGWELNVLRGASRVLARTKVVLVEWQFDDVYGTPPPLSQLDLTLVGAGFRFWDVAHVYKDLTSLRTLWVDLIYARPANDDRDSSSAPSFE